jgi:hypothetical protein
MKLLAVLFLFFMLPIIFSGCATSGGSQQGSAPKISGYISTGAAISK